MVATESMRLETEGANHYKLHPNPSGGDEHLSTGRLEGRDLHLSLGTAWILDSNRDVHPNSLSRPS